MAHIDTLEMYQGYLQAGYTNTQAVAAVKALNASFDSVATKGDLKNAVENLEKDLKIFFVFLVLGSIVVTYIMPLFIPIILRSFGL